LPSTRGCASSDVKIGSVPQRALRHSAGDVRRAQPNRGQYLPLGYHDVGFELSRVGIPPFMAGDVCQPGLLRADAPFDVSGPTISHHLKGYAWRVVPTKEVGISVEIAIGEDPDGSWLEFMLAPR
jgi:hypothetical protein